MAMEALQIEVRGLCLGMTPRQLLTDYLWTPLVWYLYSLGRRTKATLLPRDAYWQSYLEEDACVRSLPPGYEDEFDSFLTAARSHSVDYCAISCRINAPSRLTPASICAGGTVTNDRRSVLNRGSSA